MSGKPFAELSRMTCGGSWPASTAVMASRMARRAAMIAVSLVPMCSTVRSVIGPCATTAQWSWTEKEVPTPRYVSLKEEIGELDRVTRVVRLFCMVNAVPTFTQFSQVTNGASDLIVDVFGERGKHARASVGMVSLPLGVAVEIESVFEIRP